MKVSPKEFAPLLRTHGYRATEGRLSILHILAKAPRPLSIADIVTSLQGGADQSTVYRTIEALADSGIIRPVDMQHSHTHYELSGEAHHHHLICKSCGKVEDVEKCNVAKIEHHVLKRAKYFSVIKDHSLEFFGLCKKCAA